MNFNPRQQQMILIYQDQLRRNRVNKSEIARAVGLHGHAYVARTIQQWKAEQNAPKKGKLEECLNFEECGNMVWRTTGHYMCDRCAAHGEIMAPYSTAPSVYHVVKTW
jgi:hypothetical protein